jgi:multiple sugar transport system substrate-binding protein
VAGAARPGATLPAAPLARRRLVIGGVLLPAGVALAACGAGSDSAQGGASTSAGPIDLRVQARAGGSGQLEIDYWVKLVGLLNQRQTKIRATFEPFPPDSGPAVMAVAGTLGDVVRLGGWGGQYPDMAVRGFLKDLGPLVQRDRYDLKQFFAASIETLKRPGKQYALPHVAHPGFSGHYVNLDALTQAGIPEPSDATWTLTELEEIGKRYAASQGGSGSGRWASWPATQLQHIVVAARAFGGEVLSQDGKRSLVAEPAAVQGIQWVADQIVKHRSAPPPGTLQGAAVDNFIRGNVAIVWWNMFILSTLAQQGQGVRWKVLLGPKGSKDRGLFMTTDSVAMSAASKQPDAAFELLKHFLTKEANFEWFDLTKTPGARVDFWSDRRITGDPTNRVFARAIEAAAPLNLVTNGQGDQHNTAVSNELNAIWSGKSSVREATEAARRAAQEVLDRQGG